MISNILDIFSKKIKGLGLSDKVFIGVIVGGIIGELLFFNYFIKSAWVEGLVLAWFMSQGLVIYKDFLTHYFPLFYIAQVPFHQLFGFSQTPTILMAPITSIFLLLLTSFFSWKYLKKWFRIIPLLYLIIWIPILDENQFATNSYQDVTNGIAFILWWLWYCKPSPKKAFFIGLFLGLSLMSSQIVIFFVFIIFISILYRTLKETQYLSSLFFAILGFLIPVSIVIIYLLKNDAFWIFINWSISYFFATQGYPFAIGGKTFKDVFIFLAVFSPVILVTYLFVQLIQIKKKLRNKIALLELSKTFFWMLILISFPFPFWFALFHPSRFVLAILVFAISLGLAMEKAFQNKKNITYIIVSIMILVVSLYLFSIWVVFIPALKRGFSYPQQDKVLSRLLPNDPMFHATKWVRENTPQNSRLFSTTDSIFYFESRRLLVNRYATSNLPFLYRPVDRFGRILQDNPPDYWIIDERQWARFDDFGYSEVTIFFKKILKCEPKVAQFEYITIRKHEKNKKLCL